METNRQKISVDGITF